MFLTTTEAVALYDVFERAWMSLHRSHYTHQTWLGLQSYYEGSYLQDLTLARLRLNQLIEKRRIQECARPAVRSFSFPSCLVTIPYRVTELIGIVLLNHGFGQCWFPRRVLPHLIAQLDEFERLLHFPERPSLDEAIALRMRLCECSFIVRHCAIGVITYDRHVDYYRHHKSGILLGPLDLNPVRSAP